MVAEKANVSIFLRRHKLADKRYWLQRRKSKSFATLGQGIEHKISGIWWTFATFKGN